MTQIDLPLVLERQNRLARALAARA